MYTEQPWPMVSTTGTIHHNYIGKKNSKSETAEQTRAESKQIPDNAGARSGHAHGLLATTAAEQH
jgi:hypothetical protein